MLSCLTQGIFRHAEQEGIWAWDCEFGESVLVFPVVIALLGDNPMQSEFACHVCLRGKLFCRICKVVGKDTSDVAGNAPHDDCASDNGVNDSDNETDNVQAAPPTQKRKRRKFVETLDQMVKRVTAFIKVCVTMTYRFISVCSSINASPVLLDLPPRLRRLSFPLCALP